MLWAPNFNNVKPVYAGTFDDNVKKKKNEWNLFFLFFDRQIIRFF